MYVGLTYGLKASDASPRGVLQDPIRVVCVWSTTWGSWNPDRTLGFTAGLKLVGRWAWGHQVDWKFGMLVDPKHIGQNPEHSTLLVAIQAQSWKQTTKQRAGIMPFS